MADIFNKNERSAVMSKIRSKNTKAEMVVFRHLRSKDVYFQKHFSRARGCPDIALPRKKTAVFIDGDFWHGRNYDLLKKQLKTKYWREKILRNIQRDQTQRRKLKRDGWKILRAWESDIIRKRTQQKILARIEDFLKDAKLSADRR